MLETLLNTSEEKDLSGDYVAFQTANTQNVAWVIPEGVTSVCCVCVGNGSYGGGGLSWRNDIPVTPGETLTASFGGLINNSSNGAYARLLRGGTVLCIAYTGGLFHSETTIITTNGGYGGKMANAINDGGGNGGTGQNYSGGRKAGGGAGGYSGNGGSASTSATVSTAGQAGSGSGSGARLSPPTGPAVNFPGGGVGLYGIGATGATGATATTNTSAAGKDGSSGPITCGGGFYRGNPAAGYNGGIRIIWGKDYSFPSNAVIP